MVSANQIVADVNSADQYHLHLSIESAFMCGQRKIGAVSVKVTTEPTVYLDAAAHRKTIGEGIAGFFQSLAAAGWEMSQAAAKQAAEAK